MNNKPYKIDEKLVLDYQAGDNKALALLVKRWHKIFCNKAFSIVKDADLAKDIAQDSWNVIIDKISDLKVQRRFGSWALRIVYTKSLDSISNAKRINKTVKAYSYEQEGVYDEDKKGNALLKRKLLEVIKKLPQHQQIVIRLFYVEAYTLKEISDILNISVGTVKSRLFHAREKLKQTLKHMKL